MSAPTTSTGPADSPGSGLIRAILAGIGAVVVALVAGSVLAAVLMWLGLTVTPPLTLGPWLAGTGLLGRWSQEVSATTAGGISWATWAGGAPMAVTLTVMAFTSALARRSPTRHWPAPAGAAIGAAAGAALLVLVSQSSTESVNAAGTVQTTSGLTWFWMGGTHPGTVVGAALLVGGTWWINTVGLDWWRAGRAVAYGVLMIPGLVVTVIAAAGVVYLTSSPALGVATILLFPLLGVLALLGVAGTPVAVGVTRLSPEPYDLWTWQASVLYGLGGLVLMCLVAVVVGLVLRSRQHSGDWVAGITVPMAVAGFVVWATDTAVVVPDALGGETRLAGNPVVALAVGALLGLITVAVRGRRKVDRQTEQS